MQEDQRMREKLIACSIFNEYAGLQEFREFSRKNPRRAFDIGWEKIAACPDVDEGHTMYEVLTILSDISVDRLRTGLLHNWASFPPERREAIICAAQKRTVLRLDDWLRLFDHHSSTVEDRHNLVGALCGGDYAEEFRAHASRCTEQIGEYDDEWRNELLLEMIQRVRALYGIG